jgi:hypothetical protein
MLKIVNAKGKAFEFIGDALKDDKEIFMMASKTEPNLFRFAGNKIRNNKQIVLYLMKKDDYFMKDIGDELLNDKQLLLKLASSSYHFNFIGEHVREDKEFVIELI